MATSVSGAASDSQANEAVQPFPISADPVEHPAGLGSLRYVARQPIMDARGNVHGYELLFRSGPAATEFHGDGDAATRTVLDNLVIFGLERLTGGHPVFVNCTEEAIISRLVLVLPPEHTVLEIVETLQPTGELLKACRELKERGFRLALDDFAWTPDWKPFLELADYVKVDLSITTTESRAELRRRIGKRRAHLVAERVETQADLEQSKKEGFTLFQGYYFCRPKLLKNRSIPANKLVHLELLPALFEEPLHIRRIGDLVKRDASLTYRLLRMVNSPLFATRKEVTSIHGALVMVGEEVFRRVAMLAIASELRGDHPSELLRMAFLRGKFCELAAAAIRADATEQYLLGVLSLLPAMLGVAMEAVAASLPLRADVRQALLGENNKERLLLNWLENYELGEWARCDALAQSQHIAQSILPPLYAEAMLWADRTMYLTA